MPTSPRRFRLRAASFTVGLIAACFSAALGAAAPAASATAHAQIQGSGSTWAYNAVEQWIQDTTPNGLQVVYSGVGSAQGRVDYADNTVDFAVSDIGYQGKDPVTGASDTSNGRAYAYLPIVAGGTSFPYHLVVNGVQIKNLRLSGETIAKIFTNVITNWDDPEIQHDNNLKKPLPSLPIIPVVHSEGSGDSAQFSRWLVTDYKSIWEPFGGSTDTEYWPRQGAQVAENGSDSVINYITSQGANGAIGYDQYSYALGANYPVAKVLNKAGYYTLPDQYNVAVALTKAQINYDQSSPNYLLQNLDKVYVNPAPQTYPLSSYSYWIEPTGANDPKMTTAKRQTMADYLYYSICSGQREMGPLGYSPLPVNLVEAGFKQIGKLHSADSGVNLQHENVSTCHNPTFVPGKPKVNYLATIAPHPPPCDKEGHGPCAATGPGNILNPGKNGKVPTSKRNIGGNGSAPNGNQPVSSTPGTGPNGGGSYVGTSTPGSPTTGLHTGSNPQVAPSIDPNTGQVVGTTTGGTTVAGLQTTLPGSQGHEAQVVLGVLAGLLILGAVVIPPAVLQRLSNRRGSG